MKKWLLLVFLSFSLTGCATKMVYLNTARTPEEVKQDQATCQTKVDVSDFKDASLKQSKIDECMKEKGYNVVSEKEAENIQGFKGLWIKPGVDLKFYDAIILEKIDLSRVNIKNTGIADAHLSDDEINDLGEEMHKRFSAALNAVLPVIPGNKGAATQKPLYISLKLIKISQTAVGLNAALKIAGKLSPIPWTPDAPEGEFCFEGEIIDPTTKEKLAIISDEVASDKNASMIGTESFSPWQKAYNVMDYWADHLAELIAKLRKQEYRSSLGMKLF